LLCPLGCLDVEIEQNLEVIGDETDGAHDNAPVLATISEFLDHFENVGSNPRLRGAAG
jgi:hypothetical protein